MGAANQMDLLIQTPYHLSIDTILAVVEILKNYENSDA